MKYKEIILEIRKLTNGEKVRLMSAIAPEVCELMMQAPAHMAGMSGSAIKETIKKG